MVAERNGRSCLTTFAMAKTGAPPNVVGGQRVEHDVRCLAWEWTMRATSTDDQASDASHPPARERRNWALHNSDGYHHAFRTAPGDPMWLEPDQRATC